METPAPVILLSSDRFTLRGRDGKRSFMFLPLLLVGLFILSLAFTTLANEGMTGVFVVIALVGLIFSVAGGGLALWRDRVEVDRGEGVVTEWSGLPMVYYEGKAISHQSIRCGTPGFRCGRGFRGYLSGIATRGGRAG